MFMQAKAAKEFFRTHSTWLIIADDATEAHDNSATKCHASNSGWCRNGKGQRAYQCWQCFGMKNAD